MYLPILNTRFRVEAAAIHMLTQIGAYVLQVPSVGIKLFVLVTLYSSTENECVENVVKLYTIRVPFRQSLDSHPPSSIST